VRWPLILRPVGLSVIGHAEIAAVSPCWRNGTRNITMKNFRARGFWNYLRINFNAVLFSSAGDVKLIPICEDWKRVWIWRN